jgi:hypothetical protein
VRRAGAPRIGILEQWNKMNLDKIARCETAERQNMKDIYSNK